MCYSRLCFSFSHLSLFIDVLSIALRKVEAQWRNVEGKLERPGIVRDFTDCKTYTLRTTRDTFTDGDTRNNGLKSYYLDTYEGQYQYVIGQL